MAREEQPFDVFRRIFLAVLMQHPRPARKAHRRKTVILRDDQIPLCDRVDQRKIRAVAPFGDRDRLRAGIFYLMRGIAKQHARNAVLARKRRRERRDRAAVCIDAKLHHDPPYLKMGFRHA